MHIEHVGIWVDDLEAVRNFYLKYFRVSCGEKYVNHKKGFSSYFLTFSDDGCRIELMNKPDISQNSRLRGLVSGLAHFAILLSDRTLVDSMTELFRIDGIRIVGEPRLTGDGYYESIIEDPEGNWIELMSS
jgi:lactoylglutathione lyase